MRIPSSLSSTLLSSALVLPTFVSAVGNFNCKDIVVDKVKYDLSALGGVHTLYNVVENPEESVTVNTTYVVNICNILGKAAHRGRLNCGTSKKICGFEYRTHTNSTVETDQGFPIAGLDPMGHGSPDAEISRLKQSDSEREGLLLKMSGGSYEDSAGKKHTAKAVIEFQCDPDRSGLEGLRTADEAQMRARDESGDNDNTPNPPQDDSGSGSGNSGSSLRFKSFGPVDDDAYVLRLDWTTRYACDKYLEGNRGDSSSHWGFFTWLIILLFLCIAAYLIFGSWLNYNRYGARGWDLLPHGDTLRDVPYLFQDWVRRVVNTLQGSGSRGGYSAV
ncbi:autophagy-related protein 27 [Aspergillus saccharolyticus JOP 1030-1]|uniref:Autophagy-related protein 27 n=1 Tax=Aspergillus saccharolyticus JOP 1030-1 TaxID=1450539 RepID=A0A318ZEI5_9EURO|nr:putative autophagy protein Atg27 [Aspergillus saccharolyticus JOP 1030-1]PYH45819.1 putative autophagy protein Atg27 [Aspergillus saccharolyticus JOP 1030-1]